MKVQFVDRDGNIKVMDEKFARILVGLKRGTYHTADMQAERPAVEPVVEPVQEVTPRRRGRPRKQVQEEE